MANFVCENMLLIMTLVLLQCSVSVPPPHLTYLVRHQAADGSWGQRPENCACPEKKVGPPPSGIVRELMTKLNSSSIEDRDRGWNGLMALGEGARRELEKGVLSPDPDMA